MTGVPMTAPFRANAPGRVARLTIERTVIEVKQFFRSTELMFFTFLLPVLFVVIFSTIFSGDIEGPGGQTIPFAQYFVPGMVATGIMSATFANLATTIAVEQHEGLLRRLSATPLPRSAYFGGKVGLSLVIAAAELVLILGIGVVFYGVKLPTDPQKWLVLAGVFFAGVSACSLLGIAYTRMIPGSSAAAAVVQPPYLVLQFISGVFLQFSVVPGFLQVVASIFPLKWMVQGLRYVFLPDWVSVEDYGGSWSLDMVFLSLIVWCVVSFVAARLWFRWDRSGSA